MIIPRPLVRGGTIGVCAPAGPVLQEKMETAIVQLESYGYKIKRAASLYSKFEFLSAPDNIRRQELEEMFLDPIVDAVFCARGGWGAGRLLETIDTELIAQSRKPFLGFSDITSLQLLLYKRHKFVSFSGPLAVEWNGMLSERTIAQAFRVLAGDGTDNMLSPFSLNSNPLPEIVRGGGEISGTLIPANLYILTTLLGTPYLPDLRGAILVIEDISEPPYRVERMLFHLRHAGIFQQISALLIGYFGWKNENGELESLKQSLLDATAGTHLPIVMNLPYGHGPERMTLPVGTPAKLFIQENSVRLHVELSAMAGANA